MSTYKIEERDGMTVEWDVDITMDDGLMLKADIYRPLKPGNYPVILSYGPYGKGLAFQDGYATAWDLMVAKYPDTAEGSSNKYQAWEVVDPEKWVLDGYVCVRVDSRGAGRSPGVVDHHSPRETRDLYLCIEWAGVQPWSNGKVGLAGISYYASNQWNVAALRPPHLAAICPWEGFADSYREALFHGGMMCSFAKNWQEMQVKTVQHGLGTRGPRSRVTGELVCGDVTMTDEELASNRVNSRSHFEKYPLDGPHYAERRGDLAKIEVPILSAANWGGQGQHLRGNIEGYLLAESGQKWLEIHGDEHWTSFYTRYGTELQKRFFAHYLKGEDNGWDQEPSVILHVRHVDKFVERREADWPIPRTHWQRHYLDLSRRELSATEPAGDATASFQALEEEVTLVTPPFPEETEVTGPIAAKLFVSSSTVDADIFLVLKLLDPSGKEVVFQGALDPNTPVAQGWLRASRRKLDPARSLPHRPYHTHDEPQPLQPGQKVELDVEIWPTSIVVPAGYRLALSVRGRDYEFDGPPAYLSNMKYAMRGCGPFVHDDPEDRPPAVFGGTTTLHSEAQNRPYLLLPVIPAVPT